MDISHRQFFNHLQSLFVHVQGDLKSTCKSQPKYQQIMLNHIKTYN